MKGMYGWSNERFQIIIKPLLQEGIIWIDVYQGTTIIITIIFIDTK